MEAIQGEWAGDKQQQENRQIIAVTHCSKCFEGKKKKDQRQYNTRGASLEKVVEKALPDIKGQGKTPSESRGKTQACTDPVMSGAWQCCWEQSEEEAG